MKALRSILFWICTVMWTGSVLGGACLVSGLTLGLLRHRLFNVFAPLWARPLLWVGGVRCEVSGWEHVAQPGARIVTFNHSSFIEVMALSSLNIPRPTFLGKRSFMYIPVMGQAWWLLGGHFIDRGHRKKAMESIKRLGAELRKHGLSTLVAPEGTRSRSGELQPFKMGAFHMALDTHAPIVPLVFHGAHERLKPDDWMLAPGTIHMALKPSIDTSGWTRDQLRQHADALHADYAAWLAEGPPTR